MFHRSFSQGVLDGTEMRAILFLLTKGVRELHVNQIGNNFTALPKAVT